MRCALFAPIEKKHQGAVQDTPGWKRTTKQLFALLLIRGVYILKGASRRSKPCLRRVRQDTQIKAIPYAGRRNDGVCQKKLHRASVRAAKQMNHHRSLAGHGALTFRHRVDFGGFFLPDLRFVDHVKKGFELIPIHAARSVIPRCPFYGLIRLGLLSKVNQRKRIRTPCEYLSLVRMNKDKYVPILGRMFFRELLYNNDVVRIVRLIDKHPA